MRSGGTFGRVTRQPLSFTLAPIAVGFLTAAKRAWLAQPVAPSEGGPQQGDLAVEGSAR